MPPHCRDVVIAMNKEGQKIYIGCQGWGYADWVEREGRPALYPAGTKDSDKLALYSRVFNMVELETTLYGPPPLSNVENWYRKPPPAFLFSPKLPNSIVREGGPLTPKRPLFDEFCDRVGHFREKLGPVFVLFHSEFEPVEKNLGVLEDFLEWLPANMRFAFEFSRREWLTKEVRAMLEKHNAALVMSAGSRIPKDDYFQLIGEPTADFSYIRFVGPRTPKTSGRVYRNTNDLEDWAKKIKDIRTAEIFLVMSNRYEGFAPASAARLIGLIGLETKHGPLSEGPTPSFD